jgi:hypothetical protein
MNKPQRRRVPREALGFGYEEWAEQGLVFPIRAVARHERPQPSNSFVSLACFGMGVAVIWALGYLLSMPPLRERQSPPVIATEPDILTGPASGAGQPLDIYVFRPISDYGPGPSAGSPPTPKPTPGK